MTAEFTCSAQPQLPGKQPSPWPVTHSIPASFTALTSFTASSIARLAASGSVFLRSQKTPKSHASRGSRPDFLGIAETYDRTIFSVKIVPCSAISREYIVSRKVVEGRQVSMTAVEPGLPNSSPATCNGQTEAPKFRKKKER
eukprot:1792824-Rhodomonas_salina.2